jgi:hypothetical protein
MWQTFNCFHNGLLIYARGIKGGAHSKPEESSSVHFIKFRSIFESLEIAFSALSLQKKTSRGKQKFKTRFAAALGMAHITNLNVSRCRLNMRAAFQLRGDKFQKSKAHVSNFIVTTNCLWRSTEPEHTICGELLIPATFTMHK